MSKRREAHRGATARAGCSSGGADAARWCVLQVDKIPCQLSTHSCPIRPSSLYHNPPDTRCRRSSVPRTRLLLLLHIPCPLAPSPDAIDQTGAREIKSHTGTGRIKRGVWRNIRRDRVANMLLELSGEVSQGDEIRGLLLRGGAFREKLQDVELTIWRRPAERSSVPGTSCPPPHKNAHSDAKPSLHKIDPGSRV